MQDEAWQPSATLKGFAGQGHGELLADLIATFKEDTHSRLQILEKALADGNRTAIRKQAHNLQGSACQMGAGRIAAICKQIEVTVPVGSASELARQLQDLKVAFERVVPAMDAWLPGASSAGMGGAGAEGLLLFRPARQARTNP
jgi:HPt (histidine-containing phosphotransfer) domain-containing protein